MDAIADLYRRHTRKILVSLLLGWLACTAALGFVDFALGGNDGKLPALVNTLGALWVLITGLIVAAFFVSPILNARGTAVPHMLASRGWTAVKAPSVAQQILHDFTFDEIHGMSENTETKPGLVTTGPMPRRAIAGNKIRWRGVSEVMAGTENGRGLLSYRNDYMYNDGSVPGATVATEPEFYGVKTIMRNAGIIAVRGDAVIPYLHLAPRVAGIHGDGLLTESAAFNERWHIDTNRHDSRYAHAVLIPTIIDLLVSEDASVAGHVVLHRGHVLSLVDLAQHTPETVAARIRLLTSLTELLPDFLATTYSYAHVDPSRPGWKQPSA